MLGIYKITNNINGKSYIGKSSNINSRWLTHRNLDYGRSPNKTLYKAFIKYGLNNFSFEIIEEMTLKDYENFSNEREKYWINYFNTYHDGYNDTPGGDGGRTCKDYRAKFGKLTKEEVYYLRERFIECKYPSSYIYNCEFKDRISWRGFQAIWNGENSKDIHYDVYTEENKKKQIALSRKYEGVLRRKISLEDTLKIRERIKNGKSCYSIWKNEFSDIYTYTGFRDTIFKKKYDEEVKLDGTLEPINN